ncbi:phosphotransferase [Epidermidibacterium keratini]|uniref:Phosphotransferase n=1 Tax=Epidermidibacterium keratini TaxID=1891644 RepID=A0A7L4YSZ0_9ACTN|nr:phosphotransferase [Epidermidibacterium keratini]QHC02034.1 phosphotransferase [Epidermidibacterium keratini]
MTDVSAALIREVLLDQHPDLAELPLREVEGGWGNQMWRLGDDLAVRVQRMNATAERQLLERRWLPLLGPRLPLPIPQPVREGVPSQRLPKIWTVMTWVHGAPLDRSTITRTSAAAAALGGFLRALHAPAPVDAPRDTNGRSAHPKDCSRGFEYFISALDTEESGLDLARVREAWDDAITSPTWAGPPVWVHGDLHPANVVVADGSVAGVVDFEDMHVGDPAVDVASAWVVLQDGAEERFFSTYGNADAAMARRARGHAILKSMFLMLMGQNGIHGIAGGKPAWGPLGRASLDRALAWSP